MRENEREKKIFYLGDVHLDDAIHEDHDEGDDGDGAERG